MNKNTSFSLGEHFTQFVAAQVAGGRYGTASDVIRAALRQMEDHEKKLEALRAALKAGEDSGWAEPQNVEDFLAELHRAADASKA